MSKFIVFTLFFVLSVSAQGRSKLKDQSKNKSNVTIFHIAKRNVSVYRKPSFDSRVIVNVRGGQKLYGLKRKFEGVDGLGLFYKVRLKKGLYGYILDTSVRRFQREQAKGVSKNKRKSKKKRKNGSNSFKKVSIPYSKAYGLVLAPINYGLETKTGTRKSTEIFIGAKISGYTWGLSRFPLDFSFLFSPTSPSLFDKFTQKHAGYMIFTELAAPFELVKASNWSVFGSLGGVLSYYDFDLRFNGIDENSTKTGLGFSAGLGGGVSFGRVLTKLELKYINAGTAHIGAQFSLQRTF